MKIKGLEEAIISLVVVAQNDEDIIEERLTSINRTFSILGVNYEILVVDNGSQDQTVDKIKAIKDVMRFTRIMVLSKTYEKEIAITAGLDSCVGDYAIIFDLYTDPVEMISYFLTNKLLKGTDIVIGKIAKPIGNYSRASRLLIFLTEKFSSQGFLYQQNYLMGLTRRAINSVIRIRRKSRNLSYLNSIIGLSKEIVHYQPLKKYSSKIKSESFSQILSSILDISISNSFKPMRIISLLGMFFSSLYLIYVLVVVILALFFGMNTILPKGWITLSSAIGSMFFLLFSLLSIISEYVIRILSESRNEPFYFVSEEINKSTILPQKGKLNIV